MSNPSRSERGRYKEDLEKYLGFSWGLTAFGIFLIMSSRKDYFVTAIASVYLS